MLDNPKVSVIMSVYNGEKYLKEALESILSQIFADFEFIIINDGSTDKSYEILKSYKDRRMEIINQEHMGLTKSLNKAIELARGEYIARMDADDISLPTRLEKQVDIIMSSSNVGLVGSWYEIIDELGRELVKVKVPCDFDCLRKYMLYENNPICHGSVMLERGLFRQVGGYREVFQYAQEYDLWLRLMEICDFKIIEEYLYRLRMSLRSISMISGGEQRRCSLGARRCALLRKRGLSEEQELKRLLQRRRSCSKDKRGLRSRPFYVVRQSLRCSMIGYFLLAEGDAKLARKKFLKAIKHYPFNKSAIFYLLVSFFPFNMVKLLKGIISKLVAESLIRIRAW